MDFIPIRVFSVEPYIRWDCGWVCSAAILLCAALLLTIQREAGKGNI